MLKVSYPDQPYSIDNSKSIVLFVILIVLKKTIRMQNKHVELSEQTLQKYI